MMGRLFPTALVGGCSRRLEQSSEDDQEELARVSCKLNARIPHGLSAETTE